MTEEEKLNVLITEMKRDESDMRFKITDRFVFDEKVPWWVVVFSKMRYTFIVIPFLIFLFLAFIVVVPVKDLRFYALMTAVIFMSLDILDTNKLKGKPPPFDDNLAVYTLELLYRASLLSISQYSKSYFFKKITTKLVWGLVVGLLVFSTIFSLFY